MVSHWSYAFAHLYYEKKFNNVTVTHQMQFIKLYYCSITSRRAVMCELKLVTVQCCSEAIEYV